MRGSWLGCRVSFEHFPLASFSFVESFTTFTGPLRSALDEQIDSRINHNFTADRLIVEFRLSLMSDPRLSGSSRHQKLKRID